MQLENKDYKKEFDEKGFIHIKNFFTNDEVNNFFQTCDEDFFINEINSSPEISSEPKLKEIFYNKKFLNLINKISNYKASYLGCGSLIGHRETNRISWRRLHTDTRGHEKNKYGKTYYDPNKKDWPVFDVFIYLEDFEKYSGCLKVVEGTHKKFLPTFGNFLKVFFNISKNYKFDGTYSFKSIPFLSLFKIKNLKTKPGDLVIFNHAIHHSPNSLVLKLFPNLALPVFIENFLEKYLNYVFKPFSKKRRILSLTFGSESKETTNYLKSRVQFLSLKFIEKSEFFFNQKFRDHLKKNGIQSNTSLKTFLEEESI